MFVIQIDDRKKAKKKKKKTRTYVHYHQEGLQKSNIIIMAAVLRVY